MQLQNIYKSMETTTTKTHHNYQPQRVLYVFVGHCQEAELSKPGKKNFITRKLDHMNFSDAANLRLS
uniref:Uncharacterized protein n=1 Tax=Romanomermis culicivorax TaxID=13658 RepID=A0A915KID9_ROMCU